MRIGLRLCAALLLLAATLACGGRTDPNAEAVRKQVYAPENDGNEAKMPASTSVDPDTDPTANRAMNPETDLTTNPPTSPDTKLLVETAEIEKFRLEAPAKAILPIPENVKNQRTEAGQPDQGLFEMSVHAEQTGETVVIDFSLTNRSGRDLTIVHGSGQRYDILAYNEQGEEVFCWSRDKAFIAVVIKEKLDRDERLDFREEWDMRDLKGEQVPAGSYRIVVQVLAGLEEERIDPGELTAETKLEIKR